MRVTVPPTALSADPGRAKPPAPGTPGAVGVTWALVPGPHTVRGRPGRPWPARGASSACPSARARVRAERHGGGASSDGPRPLRPGWRQSAAFAARVRGVNAVATRPGTNPGCGWRCGSGVADTGRRPSAPRHGIRRPDVRATGDAAAGVPAFRSRAGRTARQGRPGCPGGGRGGRTARGPERPSGRPGTRWLRIGDKAVVYWASGPLPGHTCRPGGASRRGGPRSVPRALDLAPVTHAVRRDARWPSCGRRRTEIRSDVRWWTRPNLLAPDRRLSTAV